MQSVAVFVLVLVAGVSAVPPAGGFAASPWTDTSMCSPTDTPAVCQLKKGQCSPVGTVFSPPGGPVKAITSCANITGVILGPQFYMSIGMAFASGNPESIADKVSADPNETTLMRFCYLNATGLLNDDLVTLNRTAVTAAVSTAFATPALAASVAAAVGSCPEPVNYQAADFISCLKTACMANVVVSPFMQMGGSPFMGPSGMGSSAFKTMSPYMGPSPYMGSASAMKAPSFMGSSPFMGPSPYMGSASAMKAPSFMGSSPFMGSAASMKKVSPKMAPSPMKA